MTRGGVRQSPAAHGGAPRGRSGRPRPRPRRHRRRLRISVSAVRSLPLRGGHPDGTE